MLYAIYSIFVCQLGVGCILFFYKGKIATLSQWDTILFEFIMEIPARSKFMKVIKGLYLWCVEDLTLSNFDVLDFGLQYLCEINEV